MFGAPLSIAYDENLIRKHDDGVKGIINKIIETQQRDKKYFIQKEQERKKNFSRYPTIQDYSYNNEVEKQLAYQDRQAEKDQQRKLKSRRENFSMASDNSCQSFIEHARSCPGCAKKILDMLQSDEDKKMRYKQNNDSLDIIIYTLSGVFLLFLMNTFIKLGKSLKK